METTVLSQTESRGVERTVEKVRSGAADSAVETFRKDDGNIFVAVSASGDGDGVQLSISVTIYNPAPYTPDNMLGHPEEFTDLGGICEPLTDELVEIIYETLDAQIEYFRYEGEANPGSPVYRLVTEE